MTMDYVKYAAVKRIGYITMNRPSKRNALSEPMVLQLREAFSRAEKDASVKVIVLQARGEAFCSGADLKYMQDLQGYTYDQNLADSNHLKELFYQIYTMKKVVIASVQGPAVAGGCGLATICDFSFSVPSAQFGYPEVKRGFVPAIVMLFLIRKIGEGRARRLLLEGDLVSAETALEYGLITEMVSAADLETRVYNFAQKMISENSENSLMLTKQMIAQVQSVTLEHGLTYAAEVNAKARSSDDCKKGIAAFLAKENMMW
jgi:methylglutaconyl-CoA hydratase